MERREREIYKVVFFGLVGVFISNDDGFKDIIKLFEMVMKGFILSFLSEVIDEYFSESCIFER